MNILFHGPAFYCPPSAMAMYRGNHTFRRLGVADGDFTYRPDLESFAQILDRIAPEFRPDLFVCWFPEEQPPPPLIEDSPIPTVAAAGDWDIHYPVLAQNLGRFDRIICDKGGVGILGRGGLPATYAGPLYGYDPTIHRRGDVAKDIDLLFLGTLNPARHVRRAALLDRLAQLSDRHTVVIGEGPSGSDYARFLNRAKVVFNCSVRGEMNLRLFETLACGAVALVEHDNDEVSGYLTPNEHYVPYDDATLETTVRALLDDGSRCERIAAAGHERSADLAPHLRLDAFLDAALQAPESGRPFRALDPRERAYHDALLYGYKSDSSWIALEERITKDAVQAHGEDPRFHALRANHLLNPRHPAHQLDRVASATHHFTRAHTLRPGDGPYALMAAMAADMRGDLQAMALRLEEVFETTSLGGAELLFANHWDPFWCRWQRMLAHDATDAKAVQAEAHLQRARVAKVQQDFAGALHHLTRATAVDNECITARDRVQCLQAMGRIDDAARAMNENLPQLPLDREALAFARDAAAHLGWPEVNELAERYARLEKALTT